jgi:protein-S-isoprenylcysteine O-methyltransferase Ste14
MTSLNKRAFRSLLLLFIAIAALLFLVAGTLRYWQAWTFICIYFGGSFALTVYLMKRDPALLARRMSGGPFAEKEPVQKIAMSFASLGFIGLIVVPALDHRFGWSHMPLYAVLAGDALVAIGLIGTFLVFRENSFTSATIELTADQKVISTGPYRLMRHPMYAAGLVMLLGLPLSLGSWWGVLIIVPIVPVLIWRLLDEERFLAGNLPGYVEYQNEVHYRLLPPIW